MANNRSILFYELFETAINGLSDSPLEFYETTNFDELANGSKPRVAVELLSDIKNDLWRGNTKTRTNGVVEYQLLCGFNVKTKSKANDEYKNQMYAIPELIEDAIQSINLPQKHTISGKNYDIDIRKISTPTSVFTADIERNKGYIFFNGQIEYWKL